MELAAQALRLRRLFENSVLQYVEWRRRRWKSDVAWCYAFVHARAGARVYVRVDMRATHPHARTCRRFVGTTVVDFDTAQRVTYISHTSSFAELRNRYGRRKYDNYDVRCFGQMANIITGPAFGPPSCDLLLHMFRFRSMRGGMDHSNIDQTVCAVDIHTTAFVCV